MIQTLFVLLITLGCAQVLAAPPSQKEPAKPNGQACNVEHDAKTHHCRPLTGHPPKLGTWWVILQEGAYKTCGASSNPGDNCVDRAKATHTIEIWDKACVGPPRKINVDENRCD